MLVRRDCSPLSFIRLAVEVAMVKHDLTIDVAHLTASRAQGNSSPRKLLLFHKELAYRVTRVTQRFGFLSSRVKVIHRIIGAAAKSSKSLRDALAIVAVL